MACSPNAGPPVRKDKQPCQLWPLPPGLTHTSQTLRLPHERHRQEARHHLRNNSNSVRDIRHDQVAQKHTLPIPSPCPEDSHPHVIISKSLRLIREPQAICQDGKVAEHLDKEEEDYV